MPRRTAEEVVSGVGDPLELPGRSGAVPRRQPLEADKAASVVIVTATRGRGLPVFWVVDRFGSVRDSGETEDGVDHAIAGLDASRRQDDFLVEVAPDTDFNFDELRALAAAAIDLVDELALSVDGVAVEELFSYRVQSPEPFDIQLPEDDVYAPIRGDAYPRVIPSVADGFYVMPAPLSAGEHTIVLHGAISAFGFSTTTTYAITVGD